MNLDKETPNKERRLKILPKLFPRVWKDAVFPEIRVAGKWLQDLGFTCGRYVTIIQQENSLVITLLPEAKPQQLPEQKETNPYRMLRKQTKDNADDDRIFVFNRSSDPPGYVSPAENHFVRPPKTPIIQPKTQAIWVIFLLNNPKISKFGLYL